jgi:hypothetical protein
MIITGTSVWDGTVDAGHHDPSLLEMPERLA